MNIQHNEKVCPIQVLLAFLFAARTRSISYGFTRSAPSTTIAPMMASVASETVHGRSLTIACANRLAFTSRSKPESLSNCVMRVHSVDSSSYWSAVAKESCKNADAIQTFNDSHFSSVHFDRFTKKAQRTLLRGCFPYPTLFRTSREVLAFPSYDSDRKSEEGKPQHSQVILCSSPLAARPVKAGRSSLPRLP